MRVPGWRAAAAVALALLLLPLSAGASHAEVRSFKDPDDSHTIDIRRVHVSYAHWLRVRVKYDGPLAIGQTYGLWIDTVRRNPGPEYYYSFVPWAELGDLQRVSGFRDRTRVATGCQKRDGGVGEARSVVAFDVAGSCLGNPEHLRVAVQFLRPSGRTADWAPRFRSFYPQVARY